MVNVATRRKFRAGRDGYVTTARGAELLDTPLLNKGTAYTSPDQLISWTDGRGLIATGIPVPPVTHQGVTYAIGQANNALLYPGLGLGAIAARAKKISDVSATVAVAVAKQAAAEGLARVQLTDPVQQVRDAMWQPEYRPIKTG
jgi:malate dehydrogenase (oxaloacetate-decarboxylating)